MNNNNSKENQDNPEKEILNRRLTNTMAREEDPTEAVEVAVEAEVAEVATRETIMRATMNLENIRRDSTPKDMENTEITIKEKKIPAIEAVEEATEVAVEAEAAEADTRRSTELRVQPLKAKNQSLKEKEKNCITTMDTEELLVNTMASPEKNTTHTIERVELAEATN